MIEELNSLLNEVFLDGKLHSSRKRSKWRDLLRKVIDKTGSCQRVINRITQQHKIWRESHSNCCNHSILQIALYLSFEYSLSDSDVVATLLMEIYQCEKTFEKLFSGAIFGCGASYLITGWKSEFVIENNIAAVEYFLQHATKSRLLFDGLRFGEVMLRNADVTPLEASLQVQNLKMVNLLIKYGADVNSRIHSPQKLLILCKISIRSILYSKWELPFGLGRLPLPKALISYMENVDSELIHGLMPVRHSYKTK